MGETKAKTKAKPRLLKESEDYRSKLEKRGVIYLSRVPPFMKPNKLRTLLEMYGEITRLYLSEEDESIRKRRKKNGGNGSKQFTEGWIEFSEKSTAKEVADSLNNSRIGSKKGDYYYDDLWNLKYLKGFKWEFLTEKFSYERRVREMKMRASMVEAKQQTAEFIELVEKNKSHLAAQNRKKSTNKDDNNGNNNKDDDKKPARKRSFKQVSMIAEHHGDGGAKMNSNTLKRIFKEKD